MITVSTANSADYSDPDAAETRAAAAVSDDLAALLDFEVAAAETGYLPGANPAAGPAVVPPEVSVPDEMIDVPPSAAQAQPIDAPTTRAEALPPPPAAAPQPAAASQSNTVAPEAERSLPTTKRFGAIILETEPAAATTPEGSFVQGEDGSTRVAAPAGAAIQDRFYPPARGPRWSAVPARTD